MEEDKRIEEELFKDVRYYVVGKIDEQVACYVFIAVHFVLSINNNWNIFVAY